MSVIYAILMFIGGVLVLHGASNDFQDSLCFIAGLAISTIALLLCALYESTLYESNRK